MSTITPHPTMPDVSIVSLANGGFTLIDEEDECRVDQYSWTGPTYSKSGIRYATASPLAGAADSRTVYMHRLLFGLGEGDSRILVDHVDGDGLNNRRSNLRLATRAQNVMNCTYSRGASPHRGVNITSDGIWCAKFVLRRSGKKCVFWLGRYSDEGEAAFAFNVAAPLVHDPKFVKLNTIPDEQLPSFERRETITADVVRRINARLSGDKAKRGASSKYRGVMRVPPKGNRRTTGWVANLTKDKVVHYLGYYPSESQAVFARNVAVRHFGLGDRAIQSSPSPESITEDRMREIAEAVRAKIDSKILQSAS